MTIKYLLTVAISVLPMTCLQAQSTLPLEVTEVASFGEPWSMTFLPDGRMLVAEKKGRLAINGQVTDCQLRQ